MPKFFESLKPSVLFVVLPLFVVLCGSVLALSSCTQKKIWRVGISQCSDDDWRNKMNEEIMREAAILDNVSIEIRSADDSSERQIEDIRYFADNGFDIIIASPNEASPLTPVIKEVYESGTPVIIFDRDIE